MVVGGGPAAWAAAAACATAGLATAIVADRAEPAWPNTYGLWTDEIDDLSIAADRPSGLFERTWPTVTVVGDRTHCVEREYARVANGELARRLCRAFESGGGHVLVGAAVGSAPEPRGSVVVLADGRILEGRVVIDATGAEPALASVKRHRRPASQVAAGVVATCSGPPIPAGSCVFMDWSPVGNADGPPSFLYAQDLGDGRWFLEETVLATVIPVEFAELRSRLDARLAARGVSIAKILFEERVRISMGNPIPKRQRIVAFGAAASLTHPATGYSLASSLRAAPRLADALVAGFARRSTPNSVSAAGWAAVWPPGRVRARRLEQYGLDVVAGLDGAQLRRLFDAFFSLDAAMIETYLSGADGPGSIAAMMRAAFASVPWSTRARLASGDPRSLWRAVG